MESIGFVFVIDNNNSENSLKQQRWDEQFEKLREFKRRNCNCQVSLYYETDPILGRWVSKQRAKNSQSKLANSRFQKLDALGFEWEPFEDQWNSMLQQLKDFKDLHGHCRINVHDGTQLGRWVNTVRCRRKGTSKCSLLPPERIAQLDALGFVWNPPIGGGRSHRWTTRSGAPDDTLSERLPKRQRTTRVYYGEDDNADDRKPPARQESHQAQRIPNGTRFFKVFPGHGTFEDEVRAFDGEHYKVYYDEVGDEEELSECEFDDLEMLDNEAVTAEHDVQPK